MYSPKIKEKFIPQLYKLKQQTHKPMTTMVNEAIHEYLTRNYNEPGTTTNNCPQNSSEDN